jgi:hypothetical protein
VLQSQSVHDCGRWQFTLRELLVGTAAVAAILGFGSWQGPLGAAGVLAVAGLCLLGMAFFSHRKRLAVFSGVCLLVAGSIAGLFYFGPRSEMAQVCVICGKVIAEPVFSGVTLRKREVETGMSRWYRLAGLRPHTHQWIFLYGWGQDWGGHQDFVYPGDGGALAELWLLRKAWDKVDRATFNDLAEDYYTTCDDISKVPNFHKKCDRLGVTSRDP